MISFERKSTWRETRLHGWTSSLFVRFVMIPQRFRNVLLAGDARHVVGEIRITVPVIHCFLDVDSGNETTRPPHGEGMYVACASTVALASAQRTHFLRNHDVRGRLLSEPTWFWEDVNGAERSVYHAHPFYAPRCCGGLRRPGDGFRSMESFHRLLRVPQGLSRGTPSRRGTQTMLPSKPVTPPYVQK